MGFVATIWSLPTVLLCVTIVSHLESFSTLQPIFLFLHKSPWSTLNTVQAWSSWNIKSGRVTFCLKLVKSRVFPLIYVIWPQILLASSFSHSFSSRHAYLLTNSLSPFKYLECHLVTEADHSPECTHILHAWSSHSTLFFPICLVLASLWCLLLVVCLSPLECKLHKGRDVHLINSFVYHYLGNENRALLRALENRTGPEETINSYLLSKAIN